MRCLDHETVQTWQNERRNGMPDHPIKDEPAPEVRSFDTLSSGDEDPRNSIFWCFFLTLMFFRVRYGIEFPTLSKRKDRLKEDTTGRTQMKHLIEFPLDAGGSVVVEVDEPESEGTIRAARGDTIIKAKETLEESLNKVLPVTKSIVEKLRNIGNQPDEIEISFGVKLSTAAGAVIASASAEANFDVTMRWTGKKEETLSQPSQP
jgi:hypothetical protein